MDDSPSIVFVKEIKIDSCLDLILKKKEGKKRSTRKFLDYSVTRCSKILESPPASKGGEGGGCLLTLKATLEVLLQQTKIHTECANSFSFFQEISGFEKNHVL